MHTPFSSQNDRSQICRIIFNNIKNVKKVQHYFPKTQDIFTFCVFALWYELLLFDFLELTEERLTSKTGRKHESPKLKLENELIINRNFI